MFAAKLASNFSSSSAWSEASSSAERGGSRSQSRMWTSNPSVKVRIILWKSTLQFSAVWAT
eukprot:5661902-Pyramimonas_sp.AAC.1